MQKRSASSCLNSKNVGRLPNAFHITLWSQGWRSSCLCQDTMKWEVSTHTTPRHPPGKRLHDSRREKKEHVKPYVLAVSGKDRRELLCHYKWIKRGREHWEAQVLEKSTSWCKGLYFAWNCLFPDTKDGINLTWPVNIWITHWDSQCKSVERKQTFSQCFAGSSLRNNPYIPTSPYWWCRQPAQAKTFTCDSFLSYTFQIYCKAKVIRKNSGNTCSPALLCTEPNHVALAFYTWLQTRVVGQKAQTQL